MSSERNLIVIIQGTSDRFTVLSKNISSDEEKGYILPARLSAQQLAIMLPMIINLKQIKAVVFRVISMDQDLKQFVDVYKMREKWSDFCQTHGIFCFFADEIHLNVLSGITEAKILTKEGEHIMFINSFGLNNVFIFNIGREKGQYRILDSTCLVSPIISQKDLEFIESMKRKKTILIHNNGSEIDAVNKLFNKYSPVVLFPNQTSKRLVDACVDKALHLMGEKINPYDLNFSTTDTYLISLSEDILFKMFVYQPLPFEKTFVIDVDPAKSVFFFFIRYGHTSHSPLQTVELSSIKSKKAKITLKFDFNSFYEFKVEPFDGTNPAASTFKSDMKDGGRIIFDKQAFSTFVIKDSIGYIVKDSDGCDKTPIYFAFTEKKPIVGKRALEAYDIKPKFVVFDIIKLCSTSNANILNPKWGFKFEEDDDDKSLMVTLETVEGARRARVEFVLALILRNGIKTIKNNIGKFVEQVEIGFDGFTPNETLKKRFVEAGSLLKVVIVFC